MTQREEFESKLSELLSQMDIDAQEIFLQYALDHVVPKLRGAKAQAAQPAHAHAIDTSPERVEKQAVDVQVPEGWKLVPVEPTKAMWSELARDIVFWMQVTPAPHYGSKLHDFLRNLGREIPDWLTKEITDADNTPPKGTVAVCIYKAMLAAAPSTKEGQQ